MAKEWLSDGDRAAIRSKKARRRREGLSYKSTLELAREIGLFPRSIIDTAEALLEDIKDRVSNNSLLEHEVLSLKIEAVWVKWRLGEIDVDERIKEINELLDRASEPAVEYMEERPVGSNINRLSKVREKVVGKQGFMPL